jgi:hypothetical protein
MIEFICNVCGSRNAVAEVAAEPASCPCGSNVRTRALIHLLSMELFGRNLVLADFPRLKSVRALGRSDKECYASLLREKCDYRQATDQSSVFRRVGPKLTRLPAGDVHARSR